MEILPPRTWQLRRAWISTQVKPKYKWKSHYLELAVGRIWIKNYCTHSSWIKRWGWKICRGISLHWKWPMYHTRYLELSLKKPRSPPQRTVTLFGLLFSHSVVSDCLWPQGLQHTRLLCPSLSLRVCSDLCSSSWGCHPTISSSAVPFFSCLQSFPASEFFPMSQLFTSSGQSIGALASSSVFPMNIQGWFPLGLTGLISLNFKELSRIFPNTTVWKHQFSAQLSLWFNSHIHIWLLEKP